MRRDSFYYNFDGWIDSNYAPQAALFSRIRTDTSVKFRHENWLVAYGLEETSWFIYCEKYDVVENEEI